MTLSGHLIPQRNQQLEQFMAWESVVFVVGVMLLFAAAMVFGGVNPSEGPIALPLYLRMPLAIVLVGSGIFLIQWCFREVWRDRNVIALLIMIGVLAYLGYSAAYYL
jgi:cation transport ATPase